MKVALGANDACGLVTSRRVAGGLVLTVVGGVRFCGVLVTGCGGVNGR